MNNKKFIIMSKKLFIPILFAYFFLKAAKFKYFGKPIRGINATTLREKKNNKLDSLLKM